MKHVVIGTAGHIDHGKSALVLALTGTDPDRLKEEQARGITIDLGFAHWETPDLTISFVDVPGHERFVKNMLAGVGGIDAVLFVIAADESVMPQTREHFDICRLLHVPAGVIALTKSDLVDPDVLELVTLETRDLLRGSLLEHAPIVPVSARTGAGLDALKQALVDVSRTCIARRADGAVRLPVDRVFSVKGFGTVVTGTLVSGEIRADRDLAVLPAGRAVKVRGLQVHGTGQDTGRAGQRVALNLGGVDVADITRGDTLAAPGQFVPARACDARIDVLASSARPLRHGARVRFHQGTSEILGRVALSHLIPVAGIDDPPVVSEIPAGRGAYVRIRLESPVVLTRGDRFILRAYSPPVTIAGGSVLDPAPPRFGIRTPAGRQRFRAVDPAIAPERGLAADDRALEVMLAEARLSGVAQSALVSRLGLAPGDADARAARTEQSGRAVVIDGTLVAASAIAERSDVLLRTLADYHRAHPLEVGMPREEARERLFPFAAAGVFDRVLATLAAAGRIVARDRLALSSHRLALSDAEEAARTGLERVFRDAGLRPPDLREAATALGVAADVIDRMAALLLRQRVLVRLDTVLFHEAALAGLREDIASLKAAAGPAGARIDVAAFKDRYGVSRKYAIPLLEYLDRERVTRRVGDARIVV